MVSETNGSGEEARPRVGFLGLGAMGGPMARNLAKAGYRVAAYDPVAERLGACVAAGVEAAADAADAVARGDVVLTSLRSSAMFVEVAERDILPNVRAGQTFIDMGTTEPSETRRLADAFAARGAALLDAPVSGGPGGSAGGTLHIFVGGDRAVADRCRPILEVLGDPERVVYCGPSGAGEIVKGVNQLAMGLANAAYLEAIAYGVRGGADPAAIRQAVGGPEGWRAQFAAVARRVVEATAEGVYIKFPEFPYYLREAREQGFPLPMTQALFDFCDPTPRRWRDNMKRETVALWHELTTRERGRMRNEKRGMRNGK